MLNLLLLMQILATAYIRHEPWEMGVHKRNGVVYLDVHKLPERPQSEMERRRYKNFLCAFGKCIRMRLHKTNSQITFFFSL